MITTQLIPAVLAKRRKNSKKETERGKKQGKIGRSGGTPLRAWGRDLSTNCRTAYRATASRQDGRSLGVACPMW